MSDDNNAAETPEFSPQPPEGPFGMVRVFEPREDCSEIDERLRATCIGFEFDREFEDGKLGDEHTFSWRSFDESPKEDKGEVEVRSSWYKTMKYHCLHTGGFVRLCTVRGRAYWHAQNETGHRTPDWKLHFSCILEDVGKAWDILAALFMEAKCEIGMKAVTLNEGQWSEGQRGRELTVYIYKFNNSYRGYMQGVVPDMDHEFFLGSELDGVYEAPFWFSFISVAERRLARAGIRSAGCADGDLKLPFCRYASLRNEAYVSVEGESMPIYPPNDCGWNAARQPCPFSDVIFFLRAAGDRRTTLVDED